MKIVVNRCFGGFGLSAAAFEALIARGWTVATYDERGQYKDGSARIVEDPKSQWHRYYLIHEMNDVRTDPDLIAVVEELGKAANGDCAKLEVVEIPDGVEWEISDYDGIETIHEVHRSW